MEKMTLDFYNDIVYVDGVQVPCYSDIASVRPKICALLGIQDGETDDLSALIAAYWTGRISREEYAVGLAAIEEK